MTEIKLSLNDAQLRDAFSAAILAQLNDEAREKIIAQSIKFVTDKRTDRYGYARESSPLEDAFREACTELMREVAVEYVRDHPEFREQVKEAMGRAMANLLVIESDLQSAIIDATIKSICNRLES
jgi:hypothetical protein